MSGRSYLLLIIVFVSIISLLAYFTFGWTFWRIFFAVPIMEPVFADLRGALAVAEGYSLGLNPLIDNQLDPFGRPSNHTIFWYYISLLGLKLEHTNFIGIGFIFLFIISHFFYLPANLSKKLIALLLLVIFSSNILLGVERGNPDILIFFILSLVIYLLSSPNIGAKISSFFLVLFCFFIKLFPIFAFSYLLKTSKKTSFLALLIIISCGVAYLIINFESLLLIKNNSDSTHNISYGVDTLWLSLSNKYYLSEKLLFFAKIFSYLLLLLSPLFFFIGVYGGKANKKFLMVEGKVLDAFRIGSAIYIGTFCLGTNYNYRLIFLLFVLPQLFYWYKQNLGGWLHRLNLLTIVLIIIISWNFVGGRFDLIVERAIFLILSYLLGVSSSAWFQFRLLNPIKKLNV